MPVRAPSPALSENEVDIGASLFGADLESGESDVDDIPKKSAKKEKEVQNGYTDLLHGDSESDDEAIIAAQQSASNRKASSLKGRTVKKGGGFQAMGLTPNLLKAIARKGFSVPTPIQRKTIPLLLDRKDVVGMARTGSGKTAAFIIPMIEKLRTHSTQVGARALILSPSRELALQTLSVTKELAKGTDLKCILLVGGDSLEEQFAAMSSNPDIVIAAPGRFVHLMVEMNLDLSSMQYIVFDEADRLFEMGFAAQLSEILHALPASRQTLLFSATLPKSLVEFARAGLQDPVLVRLDAESKISPDLQSAFFTVKSSEKEGALLHILQDVIHVPGTSKVTNGDESNEPLQQGKKRKRSDEQHSQKPSSNPHSTIIFAATKHRVEYLDILLRKAGYAVSHVYGNLDQTARKQQVQAFRSGDTNILVVTDVAARGIDIPVLANVINYDFPSQAKIFVHRVGRTARAGQKGWSYSLVNEADTPYLLDLQLFLGRPLKVGRAKAEDVNMAEEVVVGSLQRDMMQPCSEWVVEQLETEVDLFTSRGAATNGDKRYQQTRAAASAESAKRAKELSSSSTWTELHPLFTDGFDDMEVQREKMLAIVGGFRPEESIFEIGARRGGKKANEEAVDAIRKIRSGLNAKKQKILAAKQVKYASDDEEEDLSGAAALTQDHEDLSDSDEVTIQNPSALLSASDSELEVTFSNHKSAKTASGRSNKKQRVAFDPSDPTASYRSSEFMSYTPTTLNAAEDAAYSINPTSDFTSAARTATMDLAGDDNTASRPTQIMRWDKRHKKYVRRSNDEDGSKGGSRLVRGESGAKIAASFRSGRFDAWRKANKVGRVPRVGEKEAGGDGGTGMLGVKQKYKHKQMKTAKAPDKYRDDFDKKNKKVKEMKQQEKEMGMQSQGGRGNNVRGVKKGKVTNSIEDIRKARNLKEKRKEKNARPTHKGRGR